MCLEGKTIQVLQVVDNGHGMDHDEIVRMLSFGHKRPEETDKDQIGHFGVGFKVLSNIVLSDLHTHRALFALPFYFSESNFSLGFPCYHAFEVVVKMLQSTFELFCTLWLLP